LAANILLGGGKHISNVAAQSTAWWSVRREEPMKKTEKAGDQRTAAAELRRKAEHRLGQRKGKPLEGLSENDVRSLVHELQVHQIELEMQNEELLRAQSAAEEVSRKYTDLFDFAPTGHFLWDERGTIREINLAGAALLGLDRKVAIKKRFGQFVVLEDRPAFAAFCQCALSADARQMCEVKILKDGQTVDVLVEGIATQDPQGQERLCRAAVIDISLQKRADALAAANEALATEIAARKQAEEALGQSEERLRRAQEIAHLGSWELDVGNGRLIWSDEVYRIFGVQPWEFRATYEAFLEAVHPEDRAAVDAAYSSSLREGRDSYEIEHRVVRRSDGEVRMIHEKCEHIRDGSGRIIRSIGMVHDVTDRKRAEAEIRSLAEFPQENPNPTLRVSGDGAVFYANQPAFRLLEAMGWQAGQPLPEDLLRPVRHVLAGGEKHVFDLLCRMGRTFSFTMAPSSHVGMVNLYASEITDRKRVEEALVLAKTAAEAANLAKSQFLANMSHELRTPMNAILGMIDVALPKALDPTVQDCLQTARGSADLLLTLLDDLLDSAKIESGKLELESAPFSVRHMLGQITRVLSVRASEKGLSFHCRIPQETPDAVIGDRIRLQQVLLNLAGNAVKFTHRGEVEITLRVGEKSGIENWGVQDDKQTTASDSLHPIPKPQPRIPSVTLEFAVRDTGVGIPPSGLERLFQPFAQADASMARRFGGTGLGLSICKSLVQMMGGRIWVESQMGQGSTFYFTVRLPLTKELPAEFEAPLAIPAAACAPLRILLVEDNPANQKLATYILGNRGHTVEIAGDGQEAISLTAHNRYDAVLMDVQMPGMNGWEATAAIRKREGGGSRVPIIAMTAHAAQGVRDQCLAAGMDAYLSKPIQFSKLIEMVESFAEKAGTSPDADCLPALVAEKDAHQLSDAAQNVFCLDEALASLAGEEDLFRQMVRFFFDDGPKRLSEMQAALQRNDAPKIARAAHGFKGTVIYLGARPVLQTIERLEQLSGPDDLPLAARLIPELNGRIASLAQALASYRDTRRP